MGTLAFVVPPEFDGCTINDFLRRGKGVSYRQIKSLKHQKPPMGLFCNGAHIRTVDLVRAGDLVALCWPERAAETALSAAPVPVLYEDEELVVFNKPWDMPCHPAKKHQSDTLGNVFAAHCAAQGLILPFRPVNRLDKDTTGIVVAAKSQYTAAQLAGKIEKEYLAILCGCPSSVKGTVDAPIRRVDPVHILREVSPEGQRAVTHYEVLARGTEYSLARFQLETGRTHQIRVHMAYLGCPLAGDTWYGGDTRIIERQALHCVCCHFSHPMSGKKVELSAPLYEPFKNALKNAYIPCNIE
ncbi:MAG: RluA family pseudouridine synthase [Oscillospiraceae bacterium]|nr:RluA family pseudouridine synthase [Oscillospiraceae bacterium]